MFHQPIAGAIGIDAEDRLARRLANAFAGDGVLETLADGPEEQPVTGIVRMRAVNRPKMFQRLFAGLELRLDQRECVADAGMVRGGKPQVIAPRGMWSRL